MKKVARIFKEPHPNILTWFQHPISNAVTEGINSRIQNLKSNARGFRSRDNFKTRILFFCGKLNLRPSPK